MIMLQRPTVTTTQKSNLISSQYRLPVRSPMVALLQLGLGSILVFTAVVDAYPMTTRIPVTSPRRIVNRPSAMNDRKYIIQFMTAQQRPPPGYDSDDDNNVAWDVNDVASSPSYLTAMDDIQRVYIHTGGRSSATATTTTATTTATTSSEAIRRAWVDKSIRYYSTVMREERRKQLGQIRAMADTDAAQMEFEQMAYKHYFALRKVKDGKPHHAERIYRRIIHELQQEVETGITSANNNVDDHHHHHQHQPCDHAKFAITTLLLALHMQRSNRNDAKATRSVFLNFFRTVVAASKTTSTTANDHPDHSDPPHQCACSAKVLQAFALFEMKQGNELKSLEIILHAIRYDPSLNTILNWKQFRDVQARKQQRSSTASGMASVSTTGTVTL